MKKLILSFLCCFGVIAGICQEPTVTWGRELERTRKTDISTLIGADKNSFYCLRATRSLFKIRQTSIEKYSLTTLNPEYVKPFKTPEINGRTLTFEKIFLIKGKLLVFFSGYNGDLDKNIAYVQTINAVDGSVITQPAEIDYIPADRKRNRGSFDFVLSNDSDKVLITHHDPYERYANEKFSYKLIDADASVLWSADLTLPYKDKFVTITDYEIDREGKVYMMASVKKEKDERERKKPIYTYDLVNYNPVTKVLEEKKIDLNDKYISDIGYKVTGRGKIDIGGFYSNKSKEGLAGTFFLSVDQQNYKTLTEGTKDFTTEFLSEFMSERRAKKHKELWNYKIDYVISGTDGKFYVIAEQYYINVVTTCQPKGGCTTTYYYNYNDIIVVKYNGDASVEWVKKIPKMQVTANDHGYYSSYAFFMSNNKMNFIYNEHPKNLTKPKKRSRNGISRKMVTILSTMDMDGNLSRKPMFSAKETRIYTRPKISMQVGSNQSLFYAIKRKKYMFGIVTY